METKKSFLESSTTKFIVVGFLRLLMLIPIQFVKYLIVERKDNQQEVLNEIGQTWGNEVEVTGPIIKVPYRVLNETVSLNANNQQVKTQKWETVFAYFLPENLDISSDVNCEKKNRNW